ncbi:MAG: TatD family hydrolase [Clostridia bacterium]|nr:TatD family hydrolase [Clostridia bacterium]
MELFDSHAHYDDEKFNEDRDFIIKEIYKSGVTKFVSAGYSLESSKKGIEISNKYDYVYTTCGISPNDIPYEKDKIEQELNQIEKLAKENAKVLAIGEIGLDYYWNKDNKDLQKYVFLEQIKIANKLNLPIMIHTRDAIMDTIDIIKNTEFAKPGIFHCCPFNKDLIQAGLDKGFYISFAGPVTFKNSKNAKEIVSIVPIEKLLIETDSPYLSPEPNRGKRNDSRNVVFIAKKIAEFKNMNVEEIAKITYKNAKDVFNIK